MNDEFQGIVISAQELRENDAMLHVLCEDGVILSISAKGIQKVKSKNAAACQLFTHSRFLLNVREQSTIQSLRSAEIIESYRKLREDLYRQSIASYLCEVIDASSFEENAYPLLSQTLQLLRDAQDPLLPLCLFQATINRMHGIEPYVDGCVRCGSPRRIQAISINDGGLVCTSCLRMDDQRKEATQLKTFRLFCKAELKHYSILQAMPPFSFDDFLSLYEFFGEYAGVNIRSIRFLKHLYTMNKED